MKKYKRIRKRCDKCGSNNLRILYQWDDVNGFCDTTFKCKDCGKIMNCYIRGGE